MPLVSARPAVAPAAREGSVVAWRAALGLILATVAAYLTSFSGALVFDDIPGIAENPTIRDWSRLGPLWQGLGPDAGTLAGRPVPNATLALNYAIGGLDLGSYHAANLLIHLGAALALFGLVRRTLLLPGLAEKWSGKATPLALAIAALWSLHPLQTESVTYLVQRVESLMGVCYLLTFYCFVRAATSPRPGRWRAGAFAACLVGMGCKEVMATAPVLLFLYDRTFVAGSWRDAWRRGARFYAALASTWILLAGLVVASGGRGGTAGFGLAVSPWQYALTQCEVVVSYVRLALWPEPLVFDRNVRMASGVGEVWPWALVVLGLLGASIYLLARRPMLGFLCAWFFVILAPTSSVVPVADAMVEHRMYLPLVAVVGLVVFAVQGRLGRAALPVAAAVALVFAGLTARRNLDYRSPLALWTDTVEKAPGSARAHNNLGAYLLEEGKVAEARERFTTAIRLDPAYPSAHYNLGRLLEQAGAVPEAIAAYERAVGLDPRRADAQVSLAHLLDRAGRSADAVPHYEAALALDPHAADAHASLGAVLLKLRRAAPAIGHLQAALDLEPGRAETWSALARAYQQSGDAAGARRAVERAVQLQPALAEAWYVLGNLEAAAGDFSSAIGRYRQATELAPGYIAARNNLANALLMNGQAAEAIAQYRELLRERPGDAGVQENLARALELQRAGAGGRP